uniref:Uncharacterized protein n=1 Tax=Siphoviridae sp. ctYaH2 TaxID=2825549 RepID=A0A8S5V5A8_9CAUD|nr:MAG TPA: hypothetical protein [Siphoviridae sp. ctYaH2]
MAKLMFQKVTSPIFSFSNLLISSFSHFLIF